MDSILVTSDDGESDTTDRFGAFSLAVDAGQRMLTAAKEGYYSRPKSVESKVAQKQVFRQARYAFTVGTIKKNSGKHLKWKTNQKLYLIESGILLKMNC